MTLNELTRIALIELLEEGKSIVEIAKKYKTTRYKIYNKLKQFSIDRRAIRFNENFFNEINNELKSYWLGFIMADGCVSRTHSDKVIIKLASKDSQHLESWHQAIDCRVKIGFGSDNTAYSQLYSTIMCDDLERIGCTAKKSFTLKFPDIDQSLVHHLIRGYFDGDGCAQLRTHQKTPQLRLSFVGTESFLNTIQQYFNISNKLYPCGNNKLTKQLEICGNVKAARIVAWMYKNATIYLERKKEICFANLRF